MREEARHAHNQRARIPSKCSVPEVVRLLDGLKYRREAVQAAKGTCQVNLGRNYTKAGLGRQAMPKLWFLF